MNSNKSIWIIEDDTDCQFVYDEILGLKYNLTVFGSLDEFQKVLNVSITPMERTLVPRGFYGAEIFRISRPAFKNSCPTTTIRANSSRSFTMKTQMEMNGALPHGVQTSPGDLMP